MIGQPEMSAASMPDVLQAEVYIGEDCALIHNDRTARIINHTTQSVPGSVYTMPDFPALLEEIHRLVRHRRVFIAFGDSTTANIHNWPCALHTEYLSAEGWIVINLADWARSSEQHVVVLEFFLDWLLRHDPAGAAVGVMLGLRDIHDRLRAYNDYVNGAAFGFALAAEEQLCTHRYGRRLANLLAQAPADWEEAEHWIASRILAGIGIAERLCRDASVPFLAFLEPSAFEDCTPGYLRALQSKFANEAGSDGDFDAWCERHRYVPSPSRIGPRDHRPFVDALRRLWRQQAERGEKGYRDCSRLFHDVETCCFQDQFDAVHYNPMGAQLIADAVAKLMGIGANRPR